MKESRKLYRLEGTYKEIIEYAAHAKLNNVLGGGHRNYLPPATLIISKLFNAPEGVVCGDVSTKYNELFAELDASGMVQTR